MHFGHFVNEFTITLAVNTSMKVIEKRQKVWNFVLFKLLGDHVNSHGLQQRF